MLIKVDVVQTPAMHLAVVEVMVILEKEQLLPDSVVIEEVFKVEDKVEGFIICLDVDVAEKEDGNVGDVSDMLDLDDDANEKDGTDDGTDDNTVTKDDDEDDNDL